MTHPSAVSDEAVFKALADPHRRTLLDLLFERDGQTLTELMAHLPMTRFGCMKHLQVLEQAGLLSHRKVGREKYHYLNPVPIQEIFDRWVSKYAQPFTQHLTELKTWLEAVPVTHPVHQFDTFIRTTPERLWQALTDGQFTPQYYFGSRVNSSWQTGAPYRYDNPDGSVLLSGEILESDPPHRLRMSFQAHWSDLARSSGISEVTYEIEAQGNVCRLRVIHAGLDPEHAMTAQFKNGWSEIVSGLKTLLETGQPLRSDKP
ncbi:MAG: ArsR/SmtB family transcription factor [Candidatus Sericytochromatia bacterium]